MFNLPNALIIGGTGRNVGKTTFCCQIISKFSLEYKITAIKISKHFHSVENQKLSLLASTENYFIYEELDLDAVKDSSRFLKAGADNSFFIMANEDHLISAINKFNNIIDLHSDLLVIESSAARHLIQPGASVLVTDDLTLKSSNMFDIICNLNSNLTFDNGINEISVKGKQWFLF